MRGDGEMKTTNGFLLFLILGMFLLPLGCGSEKGADDHAPRGDQEEAGHEEHREKEENGGGEVHLTPVQIQTSGIQWVRVKEQPLSVEIEVLGEMASDTDRVVQIRPIGPGIIQKINVSIGDAVVPGDILLTYALEKNKNKAEPLQSQTRGIVVGLYGETGGHVDPAVPLLTLADSSQLRCGLDVYEKDIGRVRKGQRVRIQVTAFPEETFNGKISYVSPRVDEHSRTIKVRVDVANPQGKLKFGMFVRGFIEVDRSQALVVPETAIQKIEGQPTLFVKEENENAFVPRAVRLGGVSQGLIEIRSGVSAGENVVTDGSFILKAELSKGEMGGGHGH